MQEINVIYYIQHLVLSLTGATQTILLTKGFHLQLQMKQTVFPRMNEVSLVENEALTHTVNE